MTDHHDRKADTPRAGWFDDMLTRREAGVRVAGVAAAVGAASLLGACSASTDGTSPPTERSRSKACRPPTAWAATPLR